MTRTTDDLRDAEPFRPFGPKVVPPAPTQPEWKQRPGAAPGVEEDRNGRVRTNLPLPKG